MRPEHRMYRYQIGGATQTARQAFAGHGTPAAKCLCGASLVGEDEIAEHAAVMAASLPQARTSDPDTSHDAATPSIRRWSQLRRLLSAFNAHPAGLTADEATELASVPSDPPLWRRCSDLGRLGLVAPTGDRRPGRSGRDQRVLAITDLGRRTLGTTW